MTFHDNADLGGGRRRRPLTQQEINATGRRIGNIVGDPARSEFSDDQYNAWSERQVDRTTDINGNIVDSRIEPFKPSVTRQDLNLDGSVGDKANNAPREVFAVKKVLSKAGAFSFDPGNEPTTVANDRFKKAIRNFQAGNNLAVDGLIRSGGPTVHALGRKTMGRENGRPSGYDADDYKAATGRDPNRLLSGKPIFAEAGSGGTASLGESVELRKPGGVGARESEKSVRPEILDKFQRRGIDGETGASAKPPPTAVTHRQAERESMRELGRLVGPQMPPPIAALGAGAAEFTEKSEKIPNSTLLLLGRIRKGGNAWERAQAAQYFRRLISYNQSALLRLAKSQPALVGWMAERAARIENYTILRRWMKQEGVKDSSALWAIDRLDRFNELTKQEKQELAGYIRTKVGSGVVRQRLATVYRARVIGRKPPLTNEQVLAELKKIDPKAYEKWMTRATFAGLGTVILSTLANRGGKLAKAAGRGGGVFSVVGGGFEIWKFFRKDMVSIGLQEQINMRLGNPFTAIAMVAAREKERQKQIETLKRENRIDRKRTDEIIRGGERSK